MLALAFVNRYRASADPGGDKRISVVQQRLSWARGRKRRPRLPQGFGLTTSTSACACSASLAIAASSDSCAWRFESAASFMRPTSRLGGEPPRGRCQATSLLSVKGKIRSEPSPCLCLGRFPQGTTRISSCAQAMVALVVQTVNRLASDGRPCRSKSRTAHPPP
jgi:hypothetical protein